MVARRDRIAAWVNEHCRSPKKGAPTSFPGTARRDASLALAARFGFDGDRNVCPRRWMRSEASSATNPGSPTARGCYRYSGAERRKASLWLAPFGWSKPTLQLGRRDEASGLRDEAPRRASPPGSGAISEVWTRRAVTCSATSRKASSHLALVHAAVSLEARREGDRLKTFPSHSRRAWRRGRPVPPLRPLPTGRRSSFPCLDRLRDPDHRLDRKHRPGSPAR